MGFTSAGEGKVAWVYRPDLGEATANILAGEGHDNKAYELAGENLTQQQFVDAVNEVTGKGISLLAVDSKSTCKNAKGGWRARRICIIDSNDSKRNP